MFVSSQSLNTGGVIFFDRTTEVQDWGADFSAWAIIQKHRGVLSSKDKTQSYTAPHKVAIFEKIVRDAVPRNGATA